MEKMLIFVNAGGNNNKFYHMILEGNVINIKYGRVGTNGQSTSKTGGERNFNKILNEKLRKGYVESSIDLNTDEESSNSNLLDIVLDQVNTDEESKDLLTRLVAHNIHNITTNTKIKYDIKTGYFKTPLGIVTTEGVSEAIDILDEILKLVSKKSFETSNKRKFTELNEKYFIHIPTKISTLRDFKNLLITEEKIDQQKDICQALLDSIRIINNEKNKQKKDSKITIEKVFETSVSLLKDKQEFERINNLFQKSKNIKHGNHVNKAKISNIYKVKLDKEHKEYRESLDNQMELFHGTKVANLLSILKSGLLMPKYSPGSVTGYMFGQGLYFSDISTKSINYCDGMYWNNSKKQDKIYMFIADIAMGNYQVPRGSTRTKPDKGFDSYWAKPGKSGILNNEMIVFENNQIRLKYILEISF